MNNHNNFLLVGLIIVAAWVLILIITILHLARRRDMIAPVKFIWALVLIVAPVVGLIVYFFLSDRTARKGSASMIRR